jgi:citrate/tricarballylate utilization protein
MSADVYQEAIRQVEICNACRYCEGYCSVFPAIQRQREFKVADIIQFANLCHNCRGCYYACQYTDPHEFALNIPAILAEARSSSWQTQTFPSSVARCFQKSGVAIAFILILAISLLLWVTRQTEIAEDGNFYDVLSHEWMVGLFLPAFILPLLVVALSVSRYWKVVGGVYPTVQQLKATIVSAGQMKNLTGGHGDGCNFEDEDRFSNARRWFHQATMYGFLLCFLSTSVATVMHYFFAMPAPYALFSLPKLFGLSGGFLLCAGSLGLAYLKLKSDSELSDASVAGGEMAFVLLLFLTSSSGLLLYFAGQSSWLPEILSIHLGCVLAFFVLTPYSKMMHGFYRFAALLRDEQIKTGN